MTMARTNQGNKLRPEAILRRVAPSDVLVILLTVSISLWTGAIFWFDSVPSAILHPLAQGGIEAASALAMVFGALALVLFPEPEEAERMRWIALGLLSLGIAGVSASLLVVTFPEALDANNRLYLSIVIRTAAIGLLAMGLAVPQCPRFSRRNLAIALIAIVSIATVVLALRPPLAHNPAGGLSGQVTDPVLSAFTPWHWIFSLIPLVLAITIVAYQLLPSTQHRARPWLIVAIVLLIGSQLHNMLWPSIYSPIATTADVLRAAFAGVVLLGAVLELRDVAHERTVRLAEEREYARRLEELQSLRADFTRMIAHELGNPLAAIERHADVLKIDTLAPEQRTQIVHNIQQEADLLRNLVEDIHSAAAVERDDFAVSLRTVPLQVIMNDAVSYAETILGLNLTVTNTDQTLVSADPERIGQVFRNLLTNAAKFSPPGAPVEIFIEMNGRRVRVSVKDHGSGIHPDDQKRIFEKFGRGRKTSNAPMSGLGLGLYISRRILRIHGSELELTSTVGEGSTFSFELEVARGLI
jgi:signal transduction histidine kinase